MRAARPLRVHPAAKNKSQCLLKAERPSPHPRPLFSLNFVFRLCHCHPLNPLLVFFYLGLSWPFAAAAARDEVKESERRERLQARIREVWDKHKRSLEPPPAPAAASSAHPLAASLAPPPSSSSSSSSSAMPSAGSAGGPGGGPGGGGRRDNRPAWMVERDANAISAALPPDAKRARLSDSEQTTGHGGTVLSAPPVLSSGAAAGGFGLGLKSGKAGPGVAKTRAGLQRPGGIFAEERET